MLSLTTKDIHLAKKATDKKTAILAIAKDLVDGGLVGDGYADGMLAREGQASTFLGSGIAIPHGTPDTRHLVKQTGVCVHHFPEGVDWGDGNLVYVAIGIAAKSDEHLEILKQLTHVLGAEGTEKQIQAVASEQALVDILSGKTAPAELLFNADNVVLNFPATDLTQLLAVAAGIIKNKQAANNQFVSEIIGNTSTYLGEGVWLAKSAVGVSQSAISVVRAQEAGLYENKEVKLVVVLAAADSTYIPVINHLTALIYKQSLTELAVADAAQIVLLLTEEKKEGLVAEFTIKNPHGLHARPGAMLVSVAKQFKSDIWVSNLNGSGNVVKAKSLMKMISLGVTTGHTLQFTAQGPDAKEALEAIGKAIDDGLGE